MHFSLIGINHNTAAVPLRERAAAADGQIAGALDALRSYTPNGVILSTCNRTEVYYTGADEGGCQRGLEFLQARTGMSRHELGAHIYTLADDRALEHLFCVASGLDSMIIGEHEVLSQVKRALEAAETAGMVDLPLRMILQSAIGTGRRVRDETGISKNALSISSIAVDLAAGKVPDLQGCQMLVIGAGQAGRLVAKAAREKGVSRIVVASRSQKTASSLVAEIGGVPVTLACLPQELAASQIVVTCAAAPHWLLNRDQVTAAMAARSDRPLVIIDIGLPRNVEPGAGEVPNVFLYNIDDLNSISERNRQQRESEIEAASAIIAEEVERFASGWQSLRSRPVVSALMQKAEDIRRTQWEKTIGRIHGLSDEERQRLEAMTRSIVTRILQEPVGYLKANQDPDYARIVSELFRLGEESRCDR